ncbi:uncharacterized protein TRIADDRAFT_22902, partial [Trichoplax adhaerens]
NRRRTWKNLKQIIAIERSLSWKPYDPTYNSIDAPGAFLPPKKYSDISGTIAKYTDPQTKIRYSTSDEFKTIRTLPWDIVQGYLRLRNAATV